MTAVAASAIALSISRFSSATASPCIAGLRSKPLDAIGRAEDLGVTADGNEEVVAEGYAEKLLARVRISLGERHGVPRRQHVAVVADDHEGSDAIIDFMQRLVGRRVDGLPCRTVLGGEDDTALPDGDEYAVPPPHAEEIFRRSRILGHP